MALWTLFTGGLYLEVIYIAFLYLDFKVVFVDRWSLFNVVFYTGWPVIEWYILIWEKTFLGNKESIRIFNGCGVRIENSVTRVTVQHHEACQVMPNSSPEWRNFQFTPNNHYGFFFLHTFPSTMHVAFKLQYSLFYQFYAKITVFFIKNVRIGSYLRRWCQNRSCDIKKWCHDITKTTWHHARESSYTPSCKMPRSGSWKFRSGMQERLIFN